MRAYVYGYPLVMFGVTQQKSITVATATVEGATGSAPLNQFGKQTELADSSFKTVVLPSTSTLYASAFINLSAGPLILHVPECRSFYLLQMMDGWTNVSDQSPGANKNTAPGDYALVGPDWSGKLPEKIQGRIDMPTNSMWIIGRYYTNGTEEDIAYLAERVYPYLTLRLADDVITHPLRICRSIRRSIPPPRPCARSTE